MRHWPVRWKVFAIALFPLLLATVFGVLRIHTAVSDAGRLRLAADRAEMVPVITKYMSALDVALVANSTGADVEGARKNYDARKYELQSRLAGTDVAADVRTGVGTLLNGGQALLDKVAANSIGLRERVTGYAPILLTAENAVNGSVRIDSEKIRAQAEGLSRALGARGQMLMLQLLVTRGGDLPEPELRTSMITLAGTEPSTLFGLSEVLGVGSPDAKTLQQQLVNRMAIMSDPTASLVNNPGLLRSIQTTDQIAGQVINHTSASVTKLVEDQAASRREAAVRDSVLIFAAIAAALIVVLLVARSLVQPLRVLRDGALKLAHEDLEREIARVRAGDERPPDPLPVHTTEEIGQVAHAVDELHTQALLLASDEARLRILVNDMFETMSRRNRSLVDQQLSLIDRLERDEQDPDRLDSLFRLDHLAARMRRNGANLLVLSGAQLASGQRGPVPLSTAIDAATSEVEDYRRVETVKMLDAALRGAAAGDVIHLLAELIDNALRYSPPTAPVRVAAVRTSAPGVLIQITDSGLGMTDGDRRIANMRLRAGGEVTPENARHMGLFVVGRLADRHGLRVRLRGSTTGDADSGTTAEVYLPPGVLAGADGDDTEPRPATEAAARSAAARRPADSAPYASSSEAEADADLVEDPVGSSEHNGSYQSAVSLLPRRSPGSSGITGVPTPAPQQAAPATVSNTAEYFSSRSRAAGRETEPVAAEFPRAAAEPADHEDVIYQRMLSEWLVDPHELAHSADLDWKSVWDHGWSAAAEVDNVPISAHTDQGLPVRDPGARLVPGTATPDAPEAAVPVNGAAGPAKHREADDRNGVASGGGDDPGRHHAPARDPAAIRASISSHFGGVRAARSHARDSHEGPESQ
jgi:signal transduction histidine kinase